MKEGKQPFIITIKQWDETITVQRDNSDITFDQFMELIRRASLALGYTETTINEYIPE